MMLQKIYEEMFIINQHSSIYLHCITINYPAVTIVHDMGMPSSGNMDEVMIMFGLPLMQLLAVDHY